MKLRLATRTQETFERAFAIQIADFRKTNPEVEIEVVALPIHDHYDTMIGAAKAATPDFDLFLCVTDWLPEAISKGLLTPLNQYLNQDPPQDWPQGWHPAMLGLQNQTGAIYGFPWHDGPEIFHYRKDLFEDPTEKENFQNQHSRALRVPKTWSEFIEVAKFFTRPEEGLWGCCEGAYTDGHNNVYDFLIQLWSRGGGLFDQDFKPEFHDEIGIEALQFYSDLFHKHRVASPECLNLGSVECGDFYAQGNAAMMWNWSGFAAVAEIPEFSKIVGKNGTTKIPAGEGPMGRSVSLNIYWTLTLCQGSQNKDVAYRFMRHVMQPEMDKVTSMCGANGVRLSTWNDPEVRAQYPYYVILEDVHKGSITIPAIPEYPAINEAISAAVHNVVHSACSAETELKAAAKTATDLLLKSGRIR